MRNKTNIVTDQTSLTFQNNGAPYCERFDDIYFDSKHGCEQSQSVFIDANDIGDRLATHSGTFTIAETGFGTGLNFLLTLKTYISLSE